MILGNLEEGEENIEGVCQSSIDKIKDLVLEGGENKDSRTTLNFMTALAVCHTIVCDKD